jgi:hypothetical protein
MDNKIPQRDLEPMSSEAQEPCSMGAESSSAPTIASFSPMSGLPGTRVTISGANFSVADLVELSVLFNVTEAELASVSATSIVAIVPLGATTGALQVTTPAGTATSASPFTVTTPAPAISSFSSLSGRPGDLVRITGTGFAEIDTVKFNGVQTSFTRDSDTYTSITARVPKGATTGPIQLFSRTRTAVSPTDFMVEMVENALPTIGGFLPTSGRVNDSVQISGTNLNSVTRVSLNGVNAPVSQGSDFYLIVSVPLGATSGPFRLDSPAGTVTSPSPFTALTNPINTVPTIASFAPTSGLPGTEIDVTGTNFSDLTSVQFNGVPANFTVFSANLLQATVPFGATTGRIRVSGPGGSAISTTDFMVSALAVTAVNPASGPLAGGTQVTINGQNFVNGAQVRFGDQNAPTTTFVSALQLMATTPPATAAGRMAVQVTNPDGQVAVLTDAFQYQDAGSRAPVITSITPAEGATTGGRSITVKGANFVKGTSLFLGGIPAQNMRFIDAQTLSAEPPARDTAGLVNVRVVNPNTTEAVLPKSFTYNNPPMLREIAPNTGPIVTDDKIVAIRGMFFQPGVQVFFKNVSAKIRSVDAAGQEIVVEVPRSDTLGAVRVRVVNRDVRPAECHGAGRQAAKGRVEA